MELIVVDQPSLEWAGAFADYEQPGFAASGVLDKNADTVGLWEDRAKHPTL